MTAIIDEVTVREFNKDITKLSSKYRHLIDDLKRAEKVLSVSPSNRNAVRISGLGKNVKIPVFKLKKFRSMDFRGKGNRSGFRLIYAYDRKKEIIFMIEMYQKNSQSNHSKDRILKYFEEKDEDSAKNSIPSAT